MTVDPADLTIPTAIVQRLESIDQELVARTAPSFRDARPIGLHIVSGNVAIRARRRVGNRRTGARSAILAASLVVALAGFLAVQAPSIGTTAPTAAPTRGLESPPAVLPSAKPTPVPSSAAPTPSMRVVSAKAPTLALLTKELRGGCLSKGREPTSAPDKVFVMTAAARATGPGWLDAAQTVWLGSDVEAAVAFGARVLVIGMDGEWIVRFEDGTSGRRLTSMETKDGTAFWLSTLVTAVPCG